jgi:hypothetical protein
MRGVGLLFFGNILTTTRTFTQTFFVLFFISIFSNKYLTELDAESD